MGLSHDVMWFALLAGMFAILLSSFDSPSKIFRGLCAQHFRPQRFFQCSERKLLRLKLMKPCHILIGTETTRIYVRRFDVARSAGVFPQLCSPKLCARVSVLHCFRKIEYFCRLAELEHSITVSDVSLSTGLPFLGDSAQDACRYSELLSVARARLICMKQTFSLQFCKRRYERSSRKQRFPLQRVESRRVSVRDERNN